MKIDLLTIISKQCHDNKWKGEVEGGEGSEHAGRFRHMEAVIGYSVQFSRSVVSDSLRPHESQHARPPCPSPTPGVHSDSCPSSQ